MTALANSALSTQARSNGETTGEIDRLTLVDLGRAAVFADERASVGMGLSLLWRSSRSGCAGSWTAFLRLLAAS